MNYPIEPEVFQMVFRIAFEDDTKWETLSREYCERINQAYEDGRQGKAGYPIIKSQCPVDGSTQREWTKNWLRQMEKEQKGITKRLFGAMKRGHISDW